MTPPKEEGEYEYASYKHGVGATNEVGRSEEGLLFQSLGEGTSTSDEEEPNKQGSRRDVMGGCPSTHDPCWKQIQAERHRRSRPPISDKDYECGLVSAAGGVVGGLVGGPAAPVTGAAGGFFSGLACVLVS